MENLKNRRQKGITLIALVVTIVVLIILATVSILAVFGDNGIIARAQTAKGLDKNSKDKEENTLDDYTSYVGNYLDGNKENDGNKDPETGWDLDKVNKVTSEDNIVVPVPKGYTASTVSGEQEVSKGFVIKEGNDGGAIEGINEFVWIPVDELTDIYEEERNVSQLWSFGYFNGSFVTNVVKVVGNSSSPKNMYREPAVITDINTDSDCTSGDKYDAVSENLQEAGLSASATASDFYKQLQNEFGMMVKSVRRYGGFYIGRYETGNLSTSKAVIQKNNTDIGYQTWYKSYALSKNIKANDNVISSLIWGCQWDATLMWMRKSSDENVKKYPTNSTGKGNFSGTQGSKDKMIPTGSNNAYAVNNIYDMVGNAWEWTLEATYANSRAVRSCNYSSLGNSSGTKTAGELYPAGYRYSWDPTSHYDFNGCRSSIYIAP